MVIVRTVEVAPEKRKAEALLVGVVNIVVPLTVNPVEEAAPALVTTKFWPPMFKAKAAKDPKLDPPETVNPVVVALPEIKLPRLERLVTPSEPKSPPPVTDNEVVVAAPAEREPSEVPPLTVNPVVVAFDTEIFKAAKDPNDDPPETVRPVVVAFCNEAPTPKVVEVAEIENKVEVPAWPLIWNKGRWRPKALSWIYTPFWPVALKIIWGVEVEALYEFWRE